MSSHTIDTAMAKRLVEAAAIRGAAIIGQPGGWSVVLKLGMQDKALGVQRSWLCSCRSKLTARASIRIKSPSSSRMKRSAKAAAMAGVGSGKPAIALRIRLWT